MEGSFVIFLPTFLKTIHWAFQFTQPSPCQMGTNGGTDDYYILAGLTPALSASTGTLNSWQKALYIHMDWMYHTKNGIPSWGINSFRNL